MITISTLAIIASIALFALFIEHGRSKYYQAEADAANETVHILTKQLAFLNYDKNKAAAEFVEENY